MTVFQSRQGIGFIIFITLDGGWFPDLQAVWNGYRGRGVTVIGVAFDEEGAAVREMADRLGVTYPLGLDAGDRISRAYGITGVPETFVIGPDGLIAYVHVGRVSAEQLETELNALTD